MTISRFLTSVGTATLLATGLAACGDSTAPRAGRTLALSFSTRPAAAGPRADVLVGSGSQALVITRAQLVLRRVELRPAEGTLECVDDRNDDHGNDASSGRADDVGDDHGDDRCEQVNVGPMLVDLPLTDGARQAISVSIPDGTYRGVRFRLHKVDADDGAAEQAFRQAHPELDGRSVRVEGTFGGQPFVFTSRVDAKVRLDFDPPLVVDASGANVTIDVNVASWFTGIGGAVINPSAAGSADLIDRSIRASFRAFDDDDRDGRDDHGRRGGDDQAGDDHGGHGGDDQPGDDHGSDG
jgi:hypothetical protein